MEKLEVLEAAIKQPSYKKYDKDRLEDKTEKLHKKTLSLRVRREREVTLTLMMTDTTRAVQSIMS